jgi:DNA-directed RNA polymerase subunit N (RpoN/RPB10)
MPGTVPGRTKWLKADLRCLMCGRAIGYVVGPLRSVRAAGSRADQPLQFTAFRPAESSGPAVPLIGGEQFRCATCGGTVLMDQTETFTTYAEVDEEVERPRRGRPPKNRPRSDNTNWMNEFGIVG